MVEKLIVVGAGGFGREVIDVVDAMHAAGSANFEIGVVDDYPTAENLARLEARGVPYRGTIAEFLAGAPEGWYVVGIGSPGARQRVTAVFDAAGLRPATLVHPSATMGYGVTVGAGSVICAGVRLTTNIALGPHVHLNLNATVGHDTTIGDFVSANPLASISGDCIIEPGVLIGVAGVILNGLTVGAGATVGGCACVVKDVPPGATVKGVPAR